jgi:hypothetical protein
MFAALKSSILVWNRSLSGCHAPRLTLSRAPSVQARISEDGVNEVLFHQRDWCPPRAADFGECYDRSLYASTRLRPERRPGDPHDGEIKEADLEINGADFKWSDHGEVPNTLSLQAMFVHELGPYPWA